METIRFAQPSVLSMLCMPAFEATVVSEAIMNEMDGEHSSARLCLIWNLCKIYSLLMLLHSSVLVFARPAAARRRQLADACRESAVATSLVLCRTLHDLHESHDGLSSCGMRLLGVLESSRCVRRMLEAEAHVLGTFCLVSFVPANPIQLSDRAGVRRPLKCSASNPQTVSAYKRL